MFNQLSSREKNLLLLCAGVLLFMACAIGANAFPVAFGDFKRAYLMVDRQGIRVLRDPYTAVPHVKFVGRRRVGGGIANFEALKVLKCATS